MEALLELHLHSCAIVGKLAVQDEVAASDLMWI